MDLVSRRPLMEERLMDSLSRPPRMKKKLTRDSKQLVMDSVSRQPVVKGHLVDLSQMDSENKEGA